MKHSLLRIGAVAFSAAAMLAATARAADPAPISVNVYIGTYTGPSSKGIYVTKLDLKDGSLSEPVLAGESTNPSFLVVHPSHKFIYAANEVDKFEGQKSGGVSGFAINSDGKLAALNSQPSGGTGPCYVSVDQTGKALLVANYGGGSVEALPIDADGKLGEPGSFVQHAGSSVNASRQKEPHAHCIELSPDNRFALACDLGLGKVLVYKLDPTKATLTPNDPPAGMVKPGSGPRHIAFHPSGRFAYVINEISSTLTTFSYDKEKGALTEIQSVPTLPADFTGNSSTAEIAVHPSGKFVYGSNRGHDSIAVFAVDDATGKLEPAGHFKSGGKTPRSFGIDPTGTYLIAAHQDSDNLAVFRIDLKTGALTPTAGAAKVGKPVCVVFVAN